MKINLTFLLRSLWSGGAERQFIELVKNLDRDKFHVRVMLFYAQGELLPELHAMEGIEIVSLRKRGRWDLMGFIRNLVVQLRAHHADVLYSFLDVPNAIAAVAGKLAGVKVIWGVRSARMDFSRYDWTAGVVYRVEVFLSLFVDRIIVNSQSGADYHSGKGFNRAKMVVIPNGINTNRYRPSPEEGLSRRADWGVAKDELLIGLVARLDPMKDHPTFLRAAAQVHAQYPGARFVCVGDGPEEYRQDLQALTSALNLENCLIWAGGREDMRAVYNALDVLVSSSYGEGFSNVIGEAMAGGIPCVVTDAGDSAHIVGAAGLVVLPRSADALAQAIGQMLQKSAAERRSLGQQARQRIVERFSVEQMVKATEGLILDRAAAR